MSRVDVIVPCYNYAHFLEQCVNSVLTQGVDVRVLIIDDCSPDDTPAVAARLGADKRVEYRRHAVNKRHIATFNEGIEWLSGEYGLLLSADDCLTPGALRRAVAAMDAHPDVVMCYGNAIKTDRPGSEPDAGEVPARIIPGPEFLRGLCAGAENVVPTPTAVVRTRVQKQLGGYKPELTHAGDFEMWMRFAAHGDIAWVDAPQAYYRVHGNNMSDGYPGVSDFAQRKASFESLFSNFAARIPNAAALAIEADREMARQAFWLGSDRFDEGNLLACREYHDLAARLDPSIRRSNSWMKFQMKKAIGPGAWGTLRKFMPRRRRTIQDPSRALLGGAAVTHISS